MTSVMRSPSCATPTNTSGSQASWRRSARYKACGDVPRSLPDERRAGPGFGYALTAQGTNIDVTFCEKSAISRSYDARYQVTQLY